MKFPPFVYVGVGFISGFYLIVKDSRQKLKQHAVQASSKAFYNPYVARNIILLSFERKYHAIVNMRLYLSCLSF